MPDKAARAAGVWIKMPEDEEIVGIAIRSEQNGGEYHGTSSILFDERIVEVRFIAAGELVMDEGKAP